MVQFKIYNYFKNIVEENIRFKILNFKKLRLKNIDKTRNYLVEEIEKNELMSKKHKKVSTNLNCIEQFLILGPTITGWVSISAFVSLVGIHREITTSAIRLKICAITAGIKKYKPII